MRLPSALLVLAVAQALPADANLIKRATNRFHRVALKHSAGLARDLRLVFGEAMFAQQPKARLVDQKPYCVSKSGGSSNSGPSATPGNVTSSAASAAPSTSILSTRAPVTSTSSSVSPTPALTSNWQVAQSYVSPRGCHLGGSLSDISIRTLDRQLFLLWLGFLHRERSNEWYHHIRGPEHCGETLLHSSTYSCISSFLIRLANEQPRFNQQCRECYHACRRHSSGFRERSEIGTHHNSVQLQRSTRHHGLRAHADWMRNMAVSLRFSALANTYSSQYL